jgi:hypothetical protein
LRWLEEASPEEIGEALLSIGVKKATRVGVYLAQRIGPDLGEAIDVAVERARNNPGEAILNTLGGFLGRR